MPVQLRSALLDVLFERNMSDGALAAQTGLSRARINRIKNRRVRPTVRDALLMSDGLKTAVTDLFWLEEQHDS